jgi:predicted ATPase
LSGPAFNVLLALIEGAGEIVNRDVLIQRAWGTIHVEEGNLRSAIAVLRQGLRNAGFVGPSITTVARRGYRLAVPVVFGDSESDRAQAPIRLSTMWGHEELVGHVVSDISRHRQVTVVGPGGVGKTVLALGAARRAISERLFDAFYLIEMDTITSPGEMPKALLSGFGIFTESPATMSDVEAFLELRTVLVVLDSCEKCLVTVGRLIERLLGVAPNVKFLVTCREPLRTDGERIRRVDPLPVPPETSSVGAAEALGYAAVALFVDRAASSYPDFRFTDDLASLVSSVCRTLDGIPLAIEVVAARMDSVELPALADVLHGHFRLHILGRSTGPARHRTLGTTLEWSFDTLSQSERIVFRRLSVFRGSFTFEAARQVASGEGIAPDEVSGVLAGLAAKSMVTTGRGETQGRLRLLHTTRIYASKKLEESGESHDVYRRHAIYCARILSAAKGRTDLVWRDEWSRAYGHELDQVRAALEWACSPSGDPVLAMTLILDALPLWSHLGLEEECRSHAGRLALLSGFRAPAAELNDCDRVAQIAAERLRTCGLESMSIVDLLTEGASGGGHGGRQFESREALIVGALETASGGLESLVAKPDSRHATMALRDVIASYLNNVHRDDPGRGCAIGALLSDLGRSDDRIRALCTGQIHRDIELLTSAIDGDTKRERALAVYSGMLGAIGLSRAVLDSELSDEILASCVTQFARILEDVHLQTHCEPEREADTASHV